MTAALHLLTRGEPSGRWSARGALHAAANAHRTGIARFAWTDAHIPADKLSAARRTTDRPFEDALDADQLDDASDAVGNPHASSQLAGLMEALAEPPAWVDWAQIAAGQELFVRYLPACTATLYHLALVGGFSAERIARVVASTGYLNGDGRDVLLRILETAAFLAHVMEPGGLRAHQTGWMAALRVRLLHARVRRRLRRSCAWDAPAWDEPINASQLAATQLAFSLTVLSGIEMLRGQGLAEGQQAAYVHLWRYVGHLLGIPHEHNACTSLRTARAHFESHLSYLIAPGPIGADVAHSVLGLRQPSGAPASRFGQRVYVCRAFIGDELADALQLPRPRRWRDRLLGGFELALLSAYTRLCAQPLLACLLLPLHRALLRLAAARSRRFHFPLRRQPTSELMARSAQCPFIVRGSS